MQLWMKSLGTGLAAGLLCYLFWEKLSKKPRAINYSIEYTIESSAPADSSVPYSFGRVYKIIEDRLQNLGYEYQIQKATGNRFRVSIAGISDTSLVRRLIIANGRLQIRELYNSLDLQNLLTRAIAWIDSINTPVIPTVKIPKKDSLSKAVSDLIDSMETEKPEPIYEKRWIDFSVTYTGTTGQIVNPAEIGFVRPGDTAKLHTLFNKTEFRSLLPGDAVLSFGTKQPHHTPASKEFSIPFYFLKTYNAKSAILENDDVEESSVDYSAYTGKPEVLMSFKSSSVSKWRTLTRRNINKALAIIVNGIVISAPTVIEEIGGGKTSINGNFTVSEAQLLSLQIKSSLIPGSLEILSTKTRIQHSSSTERKKIVTTVAVFLVFSVLCFVILKSLKAS